ncbi:MAG: M20 metallopeptidase family protein [Candidatus Dormibacteria bacterium]
MTLDLAAELNRLNPDLVSWRRDLHLNPELGFEEHRTAGLVAERLQALGLEVRTGVGGTGVLADLQGDAAGPTLMIRADMDALPVRETSTHDFASRNGLMHACGHDLHVSALLGAATLLAERRADLAGRVRFCFQPAEELLSGARRMIEDGTLEGVDQVLGAHVMSQVPFGVVATRPGPLMAGADAFELKVIGKAGHGGMPHLSVDPIVAAAHVITALQEVVSRETRPGEPVVLTIAAIQGGTAVNVLVEEVVLKGAVRWFDPGERERLLRRIEEVAAGVAGALRARVEFKVTAGVPVTSNDASFAGRMDALVAATGRATLVDPGPITGSEDFSYFLDQRPGCFFFVGAGGPDAAPHHHHAFDADERAIGLTSEIFTRAALEWLKPAS